MNFTGVIVATAMLTLSACAQPEPATSTTPAAPAEPLGTPGRTRVVGQAPTGSVVTLQPSESREFALPDGPAVLDQYARNFVPDVLLARVGQRIEFRNSEDVDHNVAVIRSPTGTKVFDTSTPPYQMYPHTFDRAGSYDVSCDIHPGMRAIIVVTTTPYAVVVDATGRFSIPDLEPGAYKLAVSGSARPIERTIEVSGTQMDLGALGR